MSEDIQLPRLSVDPDATLEDRLTDNIREKAGPSRYFKKDEDGDLLEESWGDVFERVAKNLAVAEAVHADTRTDIRHDSDAVVDWIDDETLTELFNLDERDGDVVHCPIDEDMAPYLEYDGLHERVPDDVADRMAETKDELEDLMRTQRFIFNSPTLMNAGCELQQLSACFVNSPSDDLEDIFDTLGEWGMVQKTGGGMGGAFHDLRPKGDPISSTGGVSSGPLSFMTGFDNVAGMIRQGGKRRGAQMAIMHCQHPDVGRFSVSKRGEESLTNFNISVGFSEEFVDAIEADETYELRFPVDAGEAYEVTPEVAHFYDPSFEDAWNDDFDKPAEGYDGKVVEENFWRDYLGDMQDPESFEQFRDRIDLEPGDPLELPAQFIYQLIIDGAHNNGEPGLFNYDETNAEHSFDVEEYPEHVTEGTNPCVAEGTLVNTPEGPRRVENIEAGDTVSTVKGSESVDEVLRFEDSQLFDVTFSDGGAMRVTEDHRFHILDGKQAEDVPLRDVETGDYVRLEPSEFEREGDQSDYEYQLRRGILVGDGCYTEDTISTNNNLSISTHIDETDYNKRVKSLFESAGYTFHKDDASSDGKAMKLWLDDAQSVVEEHNLTPELSTEKDVDVTDFETTMGAIGFLDGLLASDGTIGFSSNRPQIRWHTASSDLAQTVRTLALNLGMHARIYEDERTSRGGTRADGSQIETGATLDAIHIAGSSAKRYTELTQISDIRPSDGEKVHRLQTEFMTTGGLWKAKIKSIEPVDQNGTVYDLYCEDSDTWVTEGYVQRGCAEQPLEEYEACNLGHVNLSLLAQDGAPTWPEFQSHNDDVDTETLAAEFVQEAVHIGKLRHIVRAGVRGLDNVVTMSRFPLDQITESVRNKRKIGLGIMGLHQLLLQLGVEYGSDDSIPIVREIQRLVDQEATRASHDLAHERGPFPEFEESKWSNLDEYPEWSQTHAHVDVEEMDVFDTDGEMAYPVRNHNQTTVAPTGTTSMISDTSAGCEPIYEVAFYKNVGDDIQGDSFLVEFDDYFLEVLEANDIDVEAVKNEAKQLMQTNDFDGVDSLDRVPDAIGDLFVTAGELDVEDHVRIQAACQDYIDSGVSKTLNASNDTTIEEVGETYLLALDLGIKGTTIYRDGSRMEQVKTTRATDNLLDEDADLSEIPTQNLLEELSERDDGIDVQEPQREPDSHCVEGDD